MFQVTILGSGGCIPTHTRNAPGYHIMTENMQALVDCGPGTLRQMVKADLDYRTLDAVFITHTHADHVSDLGYLLQVLKASPNHSRDTPLRVFGPRGFRVFMEAHILPWVGTVPFEMITAEVQPEQTLFGMTLHTMATLHSRSSVAYGFRHTDVHVVFTGDTGFTPDLIPFCHGAALLIADCAFSDDQEGEGHMNPRTCATLARESRVKHLCLSHLNLPSGANPISSCRTAFDGTITLAADFQTFTFV